MGTPSPRDRSKPRRRALLAATLVAIAGCGGSSGAADPADEETGAAAVLEAPVELDIPAGEERGVPGTPFRVMFSGITEDSRCPVGVTCVWEGNALAELGATAGSGPTHPFALNTTLDPRSTLWNGLRISLVSVSPQPKEGEATPPEAYSVRVRIAAEEG